MTAAASSGGNASRRRKAVTSCAHTKKGNRMKESPFARSWIVVVMKLIAPRSDEVIRKIIPRIQTVWPVGAMFASGEYDVHPDCAAPPGAKNDRSIVTPPRKKAQ